MIYNTIRTNYIINDKIWDDMVKQYGSQGKNVERSGCPFHKYKKKYFSQNGEEGIIEHIFNKIGFTNKWCVDFGAYDGKNLSNTLYFKNKYSFNRCLIEGDINKIKKKQTTEPIKHAIVSSKNINSLIDEVPQVYDLLSIDIDGDDYWVWKAMEKQARVVILEYHCGIPNDVPLAIIEGEGKQFQSLGKTGTAGMHGYYGANLKAFHRLAKDKGYEFVTTLIDNAIYVLKDEFNKLGIKPIDEDTIMKKYFNAHEYWGKKYRDRTNSEWIILQ